MIHSLQEIHALVLTTHKLSTKLTYVQNTVASSHAFLLDDVVRHGLFQLVTEAQKLMEEIEVLQTNLEERGYIAQKTRWAMRDARVATRILAKLEVTEDGRTKWRAFTSL